MGSSRVGVGVRRCGMCELLYMLYTSKGSGGVIVNLNFLSSC